MKTHLLGSTNKVSVIVHALSKRLDENKKPMKALFGELMQLVRNKLVRKKTTSSHPDSLDG
jgi:nitrate reductase assembly molybdenum cofactor insertion protein NarJ